MNMAEFGIRFFVSNLFICAFIILFLMAKRILQNYLTSRMQFNLWFLLLGLLAVPFLPIRPASFPQIFLWLGGLKNIALAGTAAVTETAANKSAPGAANQMNDFALSVSSKTPPLIGLMLFFIWLTGILAMLLFVLKSGKRVNVLRKSALPLQNRDVRALYNSCLAKAGIKKNIPIYSAAFLKTPIIVGLFKPCIYLPIHLISDFSMAAENHRDITESDSRANAKGQKEIPGGYSNAAEQKEMPNEYSNAAEQKEMPNEYPNATGQKETPAGHFNSAEMRYMLLHELQHYKHKDAFASYLMIFAGILYWFNPLVWHALREMQSDREVACDSSVLKLLEESDYEDYGNTLIHFAEKVSLTPFPFAAGISGTMKQMQKRILNISSYKKPSALGKVKGLSAFSVIAAALFLLTPMLSTYAADKDFYKWSMPARKAGLIDLSSYFDEYEGSFVLYNLNDDAYSIYDMEHATLRTAPNSTYKIYDALFGLEKGIITPSDSLIKWDGVDYPFEAWNADQNLDSAIQNSVNWYFQEIETQLGISAARYYIRKIGYGNERMNTKRSSFGMQSSLKISPVEQVELLTKLYNNDFGFILENIDAVKESICLFSSETGSVYGKTGTGQIDGQAVNGWFVGFAETKGNAYFFATNIQAAENAAGNNASEITFSILSDMDIWKQESQERG